MNAYFTIAAEQPAPAPASPRPPPPPPPPPTNTTTTATSTPAQAQPPEELPAGTATVLGAGVGRLQKTSPVWQHFSEFDPPVGKKNVKCTVVTKLPASGLLGARSQRCGKLFTYTRAENGKKSSGTSGLLSHLKECHPAEGKAAVEASRSSTCTREKRGEALSGERLCAAHGGICGRLDTAAV